MASIRKRTWEYQGKKRAAYEFSILVTDNGQRRRVRRQFPTRAEAQAALDAFKEELKRPKPVLGPDADITIDAYADRWLGQIASAVAPRTLASYRELLRLYVRPVLGATKLRELGRGQIKQLLAAQREKGRSKNTVRLIRACLSVLLGDAVEDGVLENNPASGIGRRGRKRADTVSQAERQKKIRPLSREQLAAFLTAVEDATAPRVRGAGKDDRVHCSRRDAVLLLALADAGLRPGEALALQWEDFDASDRTLRIERAVSRRQVKATKTEETRYVDLTARLADALTAWQATCEAEALAAARDPLPWVFPSASGGLLDAKKVARLFRGLVKQAGLPRFRLYDLRHTFATHLLEAGSPITYVAAQLGHSKPTTTLAFYAHWLPRGDKAYIDRLEAARQAARPAPACKPDTDAVAQGCRKESVAAGEGR